MGTPYQSGDATTGDLASSVNDLIRQNQASQVTEIFKDDTGTRRVLLGRGKDGFYGLKVSQPGIDVYDGANSELIFNSDQNVFKIVDSGTLTLSTLTGTDPGAGLYYADNVLLATYTHNLGYVPVAMGFASVGGVYIPLPYTQYDMFSGGADAYWTSFHLQASTTQLKVIGQMMSYNAGLDFNGFDVKFYLLQETAN